MLTLFFSPRACSFAPHIALYDAGATFEARRVNFADNQQRSPEYLKVNPKGRVPALATERGILTENPAILAYIAAAHPAAQLAPSDAFEFARMQAFNNYLASTVHVAHAHRMRGTRWANEPSSLEDMKRKVPETMGQCFELIEADMLTGPWVMGAQYTVADSYLYTLTHWLEGDGVDVKRFPKVQAHFERMHLRDSVKRATAAEAAST